MENKQAPEPQKPATPVNPVDVTSGTSRLTGIKKSEAIRARIASFIRSRPSKKRLAVFGSAAVVVLLAGSAAALLLKPEVAEPEPIPVIASVEPEPEPITTASPLTGVQVDPALAARRITGVMIENSIDARPQSGLDEAGVVFEAIAEGGITRFMALFQDSTPANIGPIRSARPYYVEWAAGFDAAYLHSGGSPEALALIRAIGLDDLDHGAYGDSIASRVSGRFAPHNVYTSMERIDAVADQNGFTSADFTPWARKEPTPAAAPNASNISFNISGANYNTSYTYSAETNDYQRVMAGVPHIGQETGTQISPEVVIALITTYGIHSNGIHSVYKTNGSGEAIIFQDGVATNATWNKASQASALTFTDAAGAPFEFNPGQTWITPIQSGRVSYTP